MSDAIPDIIYQIHALIKTYNSRTVLSIESLDIHRGEIFALVGPSGSGKSTLLRLMNFLEPPSSGSILYSGYPIQAGDDVPLEIRRQVTTVFQKPVLLNRDVADNIAFGLKIRGNQHISESVKKALEKVGLSALANQSARTLSGGEAQRVALARALVIEPQVLLLDEPTANLDPYNVALIENVIQETNREKGMTLVLVTHNIFQARRLANRLGFMLEGKLVEVCEQDAFFNHPTDPRTAAFARGEMVY